jgi:CubicO group peptidase (beta-lactamase class C family)
MAAAVMVEKLTGSTWEELMVTKVLRPLGMKSAGIGSPSGPDVPVGHSQEDGALKAMPPGPGGVLPDAMSPAGLLHCNLADWGLFVADHLAGERGDDGLVSADNYKRLHRDTESNGYACGWALSKYSWSWGNGDVLTHNGSDGTWYSLAFAMAEWDVTVLVAANSAGASAQPAGDQARDLLLTTIGFKD